MPTTARAGRGGAQPLQQLDGGPGGGAVAEVDGDGRVGAAQRGAVGGGDPAVHAAQPVGVGGPAGRGADGAPVHGERAVCEGRAGRAERHRRTRWTPPHGRGPSPVMRVGEVGNDSAKRKWKCRAPLLPAVGGAAHARPSGMPGARRTADVSQYVSRLGSGLAGSAPAPASPAATASRAGSPCSACTPPRCTSPARATRAA